MWHLKKKHSASLIYGVPVVPRIFFLILCTNNLTSPHLFCFSNSDRIEAAPSLFIYVDLLVSMVVGQISLVH